MSEEEYKKVERLQQEMNYGQEIITLMQYHNASIKEYIDHGESKYDEQNSYVLTEYPDETTYLKGLLKYYRNNVIGKSFFEEMFETLKKE